MTTVLDALLNAQINLQNCKLMRVGLDSPIAQIALNQLDNAITALENGKAPGDVIQDGMGAPLDLGGKGAR